jgi:hypothetical protein
MRDQSGMELDWFWRDWIFTTARLDQAVDSVARVPNGVSSVYLSNRGTMVMPTTLRLTFVNAPTREVRLPVDMWNLGDHFVYRVPFTGQIRDVEIDPQGAMPDIDRTNNRWPRP